MRYPAFARGVLSLIMTVGLSSAGAGAPTTGTAQALPDPSLGAKPCAIEQLPRPSVLLNRERLDSLRQEIARPGFKRDYFEQTLKQNADRWLTRSITIPERAGHYHHFVCTDGTRLTVPPNQEFKTTSTYTCPECGRWYVGEKFDGARRNYEHIWLMTAARDLALVSALQEKREYAAKAAEILRKYAEAYPGRHTRPTEGGIFYQSLDESMYMIPLAQAYDLIHDAGVLTDGDKAHIERDLFWESAAGLVACGSRTNWGSWHLSAVGVIGLATRHQAFIDHGVREFQRQIREELGDDGLWPESVHTYHFFPLGAFISLAEAATNAGTDLWSWEARPGKGLRQMFTAPLRYMYPDGRLASINDGWFAAFLPVDQYEAAWHRYKDPELAWALSERRQGSGGSAGAAIEDRLWSFVVGAELPEKIERPSLPSTNFPVLGICTLRTGGTSVTETMMTFDYGRFLGHGQLDKMGITFFSGGRLLVADYGTPSYGTSILPFYKGTTSHNTVVVDGKDQKTTKKSELLAFKETPLVKLASARTDEAYPGVDWRRAVMLTDGYALIVDDLSSTGSRTYDWFLHGEGDRLQVEKAVRMGSGGKLPYPYLEDVNIYAVPVTSGTGYLARWRSGEKGELALASAAAPGSMVFTATCPAETAVRRIPVLIQRVQGTSARFVVLLKAENGGSGATPAVSFLENGKVQVRSETTTDTITLSPERFTMERQSGQGEPELVTADLTPAP